MLTSDELYHIYRLIVEEIPSEASEKSNVSEETKKNNQEITEVKMPKKANTKSKKKPAEQPPPPESEAEPEPEEDSPKEDSPSLEAIERNVMDLREKGKEDPEQVDYVLELRKIQDQLADLQGKDRRPQTAKPGEVISEDEEEEEEEDPDKEVKELINKRLTSCMLLALSFEADDNYPADFYEKLAASAKLDEVTSPITKEELKILNNLLKEKKPEAKKRVKKAGKKTTGKGAKQ